MNALLKEAEEEWKAATDCISNPSTAASVSSYGYDSGEDAL